MDNKNNFNYWLIILEVLIFMAFLPFSFKQFANALNPADYSATKTGLSVADWQRLPADFLARSGGATSAMQGNLDMASHQINNLSAPSTDSDAVNRGAMTTAIQNAVRAIASDTGGNPLKIVCGRTNPTNWQTYTSDTHSVFVDVDMSAAGFSSVPYVFATLNGNAWHWNTYGVTSIYNPTNTSFRVYIYNNAVTMDAVAAQAWGWFVSWCGISN